ncbi:MAG: serine/threonine-protein kinase [Phycisphaerae bacterium]|jgi:serine/threonine protein kinase
MVCNLSEEELWSGLDRNAPEVADHVAHCTRCQARAARFSAGVAAVSQALSPPDPPLPATIGPYLVHKRLGEGGMGIVYEAEQQSPKRPVAIKVIRGGEFVDEFRVRLFEREAQTLARLKHPAIAAIYEAGRTDAGQHFFAMELVHGIPLTDYARDHALSIPDRLQLFRKVCDAINYAHQRGVIHRDLKPTNILVDPDGSPKILDFGLARISDAEMSLMSTLHDVGRLMGTLPYMSPEEARGDPDAIDVRSDVYSLGVILYELLTGQRPHAVKRTALPEAIHTISTEPPRRPRSVNRALPGELETIVLKTLDKNPDRRYQTAALLSEDIERHLTNQPILARRASALYQFRKFIIRHHLFVGFAVASIIVVSSVRIWVDRTIQQRQEAIRRELFEKNELAEAITQRQLAELLYQNGKPDAAEPKYRNALATFLRQGEQDRALPVLLNLATLLTERDSPSNKDYDDAETFILDALEIIRRHPLRWQPERRKALQVLRVLYGPDVFDIPDEVAAIDAELERLDAAQRHDAGEPLPPSR